MCIISVLMGGRVECAASYTERASQTMSPTGTNLYSVLMGGRVECAGSHTERASQTTGPAGTSVYSVLIVGGGGGTVLH